VPSTRIAFPRISVLVQKYFQTQISLENYLFDENTMEYALCINKINRKTKRVNMMLQLFSKKIVFMDY
jgi:hypothetical protein